MRVERQAVEPQLREKLSADTLKLRVAFETLGCRSNHADTVDLQAALVEQGATPCGFDTEADVYVINTCTVTDDADKTALRLIRKAKLMAPNSRVVVTGCMAEVGEESISALGLVDSIIGPGRKQEVLAAILEPNSLRANLEAESPRPDFEVTKSLVKQRRARQSISLTEPMSSKIAGPGEYLGENKQRSRYHLRVQEGCENSCTFCIIPQSRGRLSSREPRLILDDIARLSDLGFAEVVLTGTHLGGYGEDIGLSLAHLLELLAVKSKIQRIRLSSIDPNDLTPEIIDILAGGHVFCNHLHICVQAFSDLVLKRMNRRYRLAQVFDMVCLLEKKIPGCCLGSDLIVGFPGESRQDVEQAIQVFLDLPFSYLHVFPYSERSQTPATLLDGVVDKQERKRRSARWRALAERCWLDYLSSLVGSEVEIVVEGIDRSTVRGTSREFAPVTFDVHNSLQNKYRYGSVINLKVKSINAEEGTLRCEL